MNRFCRYLPTLIVAAMAGLLASSAQAQVKLPTDPEAWLNSGPITSEMLEGKAAYIYFFEENSTTCRLRWPQMIAATKKYEGKPVIFIAVSSGLSRGDVQTYIRATGLPWPVIVDYDRSFERAANVLEVSMQNVYQPKLLMPSGIMENCPSEIDEALPRAMATAKWRVDPTTIPEPLKGAWLAIEFGNFGPTAAPIKKGSFSNSPDVRAAAEKLMAAVTAELNKDAAGLTLSLDSGDKWQAYKRHTAFLARFKGYDLPSDKAIKAKELAADESVKYELAAIKLLDSALRQSGEAAASGMRCVLKQYPNTEAATRAQTWLDKAAG